MQNSIYNSKEAEERWQNLWEEEGTYKFDAKGGKPIFSIDTPPPTVSGSMHIGHAFSYSHMDFIARYQRMAGRNVLMPFGTDDNGLPTERLVEKLNNVKSKKMKRRDFIELCLKTLEKIRPDFVKDWKRIGISADWSISYSTINEHCRRISQESFIELYEKGFIYRIKSPFIWCPECQTSIAQVELEDREQKSNLLHLELPVEMESIIIATTRPEMLPACVAVYVNPMDKRYSKFIGKKARLPLVKREVPIMANEEVDMEYGTGAVYHSTYGDMTDADWAKKYKTEIIEILNPDGTLNSKAGPYEGMKIIEAREKITEHLGKSVVKTEAITHIVNTHDRCGTDIEILSTYQWFVKYPDKKKLLDAGNKLVWHPEHMKNRYDNWVNGLKWDWCISRQRYFGVAFPLWYDKKGNIILADRDQLPVDPLEDKPKGHDKDVVPEKDVMDTWATSALTPKIVMDLLKDSPVYDDLFPMLLRPQAHDIISFWLFNTVVKSLLHTNSIPWENVMVSGWALDPKGSKMSKSKGNVIAPQDMIKKYSADALRYWAAGSSLGEDMSFQEKEMVAGTKTMTKLWNASKFVLSVGDEQKPKILNPADKWVLTKLTKAVKKCSEAFKNYQYSKAKNEIDSFFWHTFADNYIEMSKDRIYNPGKYSKDDINSAKFALRTCMIAILKAFAPIMPHITEEIYRKMYGFEDSIHLSSWPDFNFSYPEEEKAGDKAVDVIMKIRKYKSDKRLAMNKNLKKVIVKDISVRPLAETIMSTMKIENLSIESGSDQDIKIIE